jgi:hypothetical protein
MEANSYAYLENGEIKFCLLGDNEKFISSNSFVGIRTQKFKLALRDDFICGICGNTYVDFKDTDIDHIIPKSRGGNNGLNNKQVTHKRCNSTKSSRFTERCLEKYLILNSGCQPPIEPEIQQVSYKEPKKAKRRPLILTEKVLSDSPVKLWNEIASHGVKRLSYELFLEHFEEYRKAQATLL